MRTLALILVIIGSLNWGGIGVFGTDFLGNLLGGTLSTISRAIYSIVGIAGIYLAFTSLFNNDNE